VEYGIGDARLTLLRHEHNTTFRVDGDGATSVLRINRPGVHTPATIAGRRSLPANADDHLAALTILRRIQLLTWVIESRGHAAFRADWRTWARAHLDALASSAGR
jgi:hypothetical protein